jgi:hypothetical protein
MNGEKNNQERLSFFATSKEFGISLLMWAFTVHSSVPSAAPISLFDRPPTRSPKPLSRFEGKRRGFTCDRLTHQTA